MQRETFTGVISIGQRLHCGLSGGRNGTVVAIHGSQSPESVGSLAGGFVATGGNAYIDVIWDSGARSNKVPECIVRGVQWQIFDEVRSTDDILDAIDNARRYDIRATASAEGKAARLRAERDEHRANYPHLVPVAEGQDNGSKLAAKNIRIELKRSFPGVKFSVTTDYNSINVSWNDGPASSLVKPFVNRHSSGTFDGMTDCSGWDDENTFGQVFGESRYANCNREVSDESLEVIARAYCEYYDQEFVGMNECFALGRGDHISLIAGRIASGYTIPNGHKITGIVRTEQTSGCAIDYNEFFAIVTEPIASEEIEAKKLQAKLPVFTKFRSGYLLADPKYTFSSQRFRKLERAEAAAAKVSKLGFVVEIISSHRCGHSEYMIKLVSMPASEEQVASDAVEVQAIQPEISKPIQPVASEQEDESHLEIFHWL